MDEKVRFTYDLYRTTKVEVRDGEGEREGVVALSLLRGGFGGGVVVVEGFAGAFERGCRCGRRTNGEVSA